MLEEDEDKNEDEDKKVYTLDLSNMKKSVVKDGKVIKTEKFNPMSIEELSESLKLDRLNEKIFKLESIDGVLRYLYEDLKQMLCGASKKEEDILDAFIDLGCKLTVYIRYLEKEKENVSIN